MARTKKLTAKELDAQIGYGEVIDVSTVVAKMKKKTKISDKKATKKTDAEVIKETAKEISETLKEVKEEIVKVHIEPSRCGVGFEVWVAYKREGYLRTLWKPIQAPFACDAIQIAEQYIKQMNLVQKEVIV